jgi:hypothetical protein
VSAWREVDRRQQYRGRLAKLPEFDELEHQRRYLLGLRVLARARLGATPADLARRPKPASQAGNVIVGNWWPRRAGIEL